MYVCMHACMHACMHVCMYVCVCTVYAHCMQLYTYIYIYIHTHTHIYIYVIRCRLLHGIAWLSHNCDYTSAIWQNLKVAYNNSCSVPPYREIMCSAGVLPAALSPSQYAYCCIRPSPHCTVLSFFVWCSTMSPWNRGCHDKMQGFLCSKCMPGAVCQFSRMLISLPLCCISTALACMCICMHE